MKNANELIIEKDPYVFSKNWHKLFPPMIVVSITNVCNLECIHCYHSKFKKLPEYKANMLPWKIWEKICEEMSHWPGSILNFGTDGEPLLHPKFLDMLRFARKQSIFLINITTNGVQMNQGFIETLIKEDLSDIINISLDAHSPESYKKIRGGNYEKVLKNTLFLIKMRNEVNSQMKIQVNIINQPEVANEISDFVTFWEKKVDNVMVRTYYDATAVTGGTGPDITGKQKKFEKVERWPCQQLWRRFNICDDATVRFCVDDWFNKTAIGNLYDNSISEIWTGYEYNRLRAFHISGHFAEMPYCSNCTEWQGMKWNYDYFLAMNKMLGKNLI